VIQEILNDGPAAPDIGLSIVFGRSGNRYKSLGITR
jgi:hypothetical protein